MRRQDSTGTRGVLTADLDAARGLAGEWSGTSPRDDVTVLWPEADLNPHGLDLRKSALSGSDLGSPNDIPACQVMITTCPRADCTKSPCTLATEFVLDDAVR